MSTSGSPWAIVLLGAVMAGIGVLMEAVPDAGDGDASSVGWSSLIGLGAAIAAFGAGAARRQDGRFGGRGWTVIGFVVLAATCVVIGVRAGGGAVSVWGALGMAAGCLCLVAAGVTISRGVLARRMSATTPVPVDSIGESLVERVGPPAPLRLDVLDVDDLDGDAARLALERRGLPERGVRMLYLWVFDARTNVGLIERWRNVGPVQLLSGGGALGGLGTLAAAVTGRLDDLIEESADEVTTKLAAFDYGRDTHGRFAVNTILCGDRSWRIALDQLIGTTDVVQMDLGGFDEDNQGCAHELGLLVDRVPLDRVLLVLDDSTDVALLRRVLEAAWRQMDAGSPNRAAGTRPLIAVQAPLVGRAPGPDTDLAAHIERQELSVFQLMVERADRTTGG